MALKNLNLRSDSTCSYCGKADETPLQVFYDCDLAAETRNFLKSPKSVPTDNNMLKHWILVLKTHGSYAIWTDLAICWKLWQARNARHFSSIQFSAYTIYLDTIKVANAGSSTSMASAPFAISLQQDSLQSSSLVPDSKFAQVYVDGAHKHGKGAVGGVIAENGKISICWSIAFDTCTIAAYAEARAIYEDFLKCDQLQIKRVIVYTDFQLL